ncbi:unnamed protein product [Brassicogethes aeneus]|uniref:Ribosome assembly factor mrt4 n=1 Tax=Brassicogethes aeneus TaxID=1431903 RepID=A0A9P0ANE6_BRAAE|nr:unnamed protein product [Brassicogethes aeneus]
MPKSKRDKKISLTKTDKKGLALKQKIAEDVKNCVEKFNSVYVFTYKNIRNDKMKEIREQWKPSKFFFGKIKILQIGLGRTEEEEVEEGLHKFSKCLKGQCALFFTDRPEKEVKDWFNDFSYDGFARSGFKVKESISLEAGPLDQFAHSMEPYLRQLGLPTKLDKGIVTLIKDYDICKEGNVLTPEQAKILELLGYRLATFTLDLMASWHKDKGLETYKVNKEEVSKESDEEMEDE